jgi:uncharacterized protein DUF4226
MPEEVGLHADAARANEATLIQRFRISGEADQAFVITLQDAYESALRGRRQLDAIGAEIDSAVAHQQALALDTPAGAREFSTFLAAKTRDIQRVVAHTVADSRAKAAGLQALSTHYAVTPVRGGPEFVGADNPPAAPGEDKPALWPWDDTTVSGTPVRPFDGVLDDQAWQIARQSPTLLDQWSQLRREGWRFESNPSRGTYTQYDGKRGKVINIDPSLRDDPARLVNDVAHEMGHALSGAPQVDRSSRESCIQSQLDDEGAAMMNSMLVEREILAHGGPDIIPPKDPGSQFKPFYDQYLQAGSTREAYRAAITAIGKGFGTLHPSTEPGATYHDYYGQTCPAQ